MNASNLSSETLHASCVVKDGCAILISGRSGSGKSDLALRLMDRGAQLVSDDYTIVRRVDGRLLARAPANIEGKMEVRGIGILSFETTDDAPVCLLVELDVPPERMPARGQTMRVAGVELPAIAVSALEASAPIKVEVALKQFGLKV